MTKRRSNKIGSSSTISPLNSSFATNEHQKINNNDTIMEDNERRRGGQISIDNNSSVGNSNRRANSMNSNRSYNTKKQQVAMSDSKLSEEAALTARLFGGGGVGGGAPSAAWMDDDDNEDDDDALNTHNSMVSNNNMSGGEGDLLFAIDRSGEEGVTTDDNIVQSEENESEEDHHLKDNDDRSNEDDYDSGDDDDVEDVDNKASMTGAAWQDSDTDNSSSDSEDEDDSSDEDDNDSSSDNNASDFNSNNNKKKKGVSLVDGPDRLKKLRRYRDETNPLSFKEYELRLRERFMSTSSVAARTDWASVGLAQKQQQQQLEDEDEDGGVQRRKKNKKNKTRGYASSSSSEDSSDDDEEYKDKATQLLQSNASLFETSNKSGLALPPTLLNVVRARNGNLSDPNNSVVNATQFHPQSDEDSPLLMTAGMDKMLRFFRINDDNNNGENTKIHGIHFPKMPITCASFLGGHGSTSSNVVLSGRRPFFYVYDAISGSIRKIPSIIGRSERSLERFVVSPPSSCNRSMIAFIGNDGYIILVDGVTYQWIGDLKMNGSVRAVTFSEDGEYIMGSGSDGDVYK